MPKSLLPHEGLTLEAMLAPVSLPTTALIHGSYSVGPVSPFCVAFQVATREYFLAHTKKGSIYKPRVLFWAWVVAKGQ
jgi:hypothetical protein